MKNIVKKLNKLIKEYKVYTKIELNNSKILVKRLDTFNLSISDREIFDEYITVLM